MITTNLDRIWERVVAEIPSRHFPAELQHIIFGYRAALAEFAAGSKGFRYLEIGCRLGHSLATVALAAGDRLSRAVVVDMWIENYGDEPNPGPGEVFQHLRALGVDTLPIELIQGNSHTILPWITGREKKFDLILVDGDHTERGAEMDLRDALDLLAPGGLLIFDDAVEPLLSVWRSVVSSGHWDCCEILTSPVPWCSLRGRS